MKFGAVVSNVKDKRIILIDDSIVRGTTMQPIVALLRRAGAKEVCFYIAFFTFDILILNFNLKFTLALQHVTWALTLTQLAKRTLILGWS